MRNKTAFIFVLLANLVLLAHAVIPHHYHTKSEIVFSLECSQEDEHNHDESFLICHEEHEEHETESCSIAQTLLLPNNQFRVSDNTAELESADILFIALFVYNFSSQNNFADDSYIAEENIPIPTRFLISSQGLRAPPVC